MTPPIDPLAAVTHPDPYPYYAALVAQTPIYRDAGLGLWVASSAAAVEAVLSSACCRVRPPAEPVPQALLGSPAAAIFGRLVRMNDGPGHRPFKQAVTGALASVNATQALARSAQWAQFLLPRDRAPVDPARLTDFVFALPVYVIAGLLGVRPPQLSDVVAWTRDFVRGIAPGSDPEQVERGKRAAGRLWEVFGALAADPPDGLLRRLAEEAAHVGRADGDPIVANAIGFLSQAYEATAGLIGNTLLALAQHEDLRAEIMTNPDRWTSVLAEVLRYDPPIQNTRRFLDRDETVAGQKMQAGDAVLVVLAAANRDPAVNPQPARFDIRRKNGRRFSFGLGMHACPGHALAAAIARGGVEHLLGMEIDLDRLRRTVRCRTSANARVPVFIRPGAN